MKGGDGEGMRKWKKKSFHLVVSALDSVISCGACDDDGLGDLRRLGRNGREKRNASRRAITGVGRSCSRKLSH